MAVYAILENEIHAAPLSESLLSSQVRKSFVLIFDRLMHCFSSESHAAWKKRRTAAQTVMAAPTTDRIQSISKIQSIPKREKREGKQE